MRFNFLKESKHGCIFYPEVVCDNVVSNDITIMLALCGDVIIFGQVFYFFLVK